MADRHKFWEEFEQAFSTGGTGAVRHCMCGRIFYNPDGGWTWDEGELDALAKNANATSVEWSCGEVSFDGQVFAADCDCWHGRGLRIIRWILTHDRFVAAFLNAVKTRKVADAAVAPAVTT